MSNISFPEGVTWGYKYLTGGDLVDSSFNTFPEMYNGVKNPVIRVNSNIVDCYKLFIGASNLKDVASFDTSNATSMVNMFGSCTQLLTVPHFDTSNVTSMANMFNGCEQLLTVPHFDTSNVTSMANMFKGCRKITTVPHFDTSNVTDMSSMFDSNGGSPLLKSVPHFDTSNVTNMSSMFNGQGSLKTIPQFDTRKVTSMGSMFNGTSLKSVPEFDASSVTSGTPPFSYSSISTLTDMGGFKNLKASWYSNAFERCPNLTVESLMNIINNLYDWSGNTDGKAPLYDGTIHSFGTTHKISFGSTNLAKLTDEQKAVATNKGWTLV